MVKEDKINSHVLKIFAKSNPKFRLIIAPKHYARKDKTRCTVIGR